MDMNMNVRWDRNVLEMVTCLFNIKIKWNVIETYVWDFMMHEDCGNICPSYNFLNKQKETLV